MKNRRAFSVLVIGLGLLAMLVSLPAMPVQADDTGWRNPSSNVADTGGDGDGFELNPANAYADGSGFAENRDNGWSLGWFADHTDQHRYYDYGFSIPSGATIQGIEVRLDWWLDDAGGTNWIGVELSWDGGTSWTSTQVDTSKPTSETTITLGGTGDTWGRTWSPGDFSDANFRVRVSCYSDDTSRDFYLDWLRVRVTYTVPPTATPTPTDTPIPTLTPTPTLPPPCPEYLQNGGFESDWASWITTGNPAVVNNPNYAGSRSARLARDYSTTDEVYQAIAVPSNAGVATLRYWWRMSSQEISGPEDFLYVRIRDGSGATIVEVQQLDNTEVEDEWRQTTFVWSGAGDYAGQTVQIYFLGTSDGDRRTSFYIDEVSFEICPAEFPTYQIEASAPGVTIVARVHLVGGNPEILSWEALP
jgi:hypothetical protein